MGKRSKKRLSRHERDQAGCIRGLISVFDFRHNRTTKRLLTDRSQVTKQALDAEHLSTKTIPPNSNANLQNVTDDEESKTTPLVDSAKTSVKELMEDEMTNEHVPMNQSNDTEMGLEQINTKIGCHMRKNSKRENKIRNKSSDMDATELDILKRLMHGKFLKDNLDLQTIIEELAHINQRSTNPKHDSHGNDVIEEEIVTAVKMLLDTKYFGEEEKSCCSKELMDALQTLVSNKGLFFELLQDPNSAFVKKIKKLEDFRITKELQPGSFSGFGSLEKKPKSNNLFRRRSKSFESLHLGREADSRSLNKIVILKPGPGGAHSPDIDVANGRRSFQSDHTPNPRHASQFSFTEIKRKLRHAMGKERNGISPERLRVVSPKQQNGKNGENLGWSSPNRNHFYSERFTKASTSFKNGEQVKDNGSTMMNENSRPGISNIYIEAKKHLSEIVNNVEISESRSGKSPKSLGRILSFPDYNSSPCFSPRENGGDTFITAQMRLSPRGMAKSNVTELLHENRIDLPSPRRKSLESQEPVSCSNLNDEEQSSIAVINIPPTSDNGCSLTEYSITSEVANSSSETTEPNPQKEEKIVNETSESKHGEEDEKIIGCSSECSNSVSVDIPNAEMREVAEDEIASRCFEDYPLSIKMDLIREEQISSPPRKEVENSECATNHVERCSPVSVLDPLFTEDDISPASTISRPVEKEIQPQHIHFEEQSATIRQEPCIRISLEDEESAFEYVEAVLLGSGLNWDEFLLRWLSFEEILDLSLFDEVELFSSRSRHDQKFLFDCANDALKELCEIHFCGISHVKNTRPVPNGMDLINEIWKRVECHLLQNPHPYSLDQLVKSDMAGSGKWMNLKPDIEVIGFEMGNTIFDELVEETALSFIDDTSKCEFQMLVDERYGNEDANL